MLVVMGPCCYSRMTAACIAAALTSAVGCTSLLGATDVPNLEDGGGDVTVAEAGVDGPPGGDDRRPDGPRAEAEACVPATCALLDASCGSPSNGCGVALSCGSCTAPTTCGGGSDPHGCGCVPETDAFTGASLHGWTFFGLSGYSLTLDPVDSAATVSGDGFNGSCAAAGMEKTYAIVPGTFQVSFGWQAASNDAACGNSTTAYLQVRDAVKGTALRSVTLFNGGGNTGWRTYADDFSQFVTGVTSVTLQLYLQDCWGANCNQQDWYKDIVVKACP